MIKKVIGGFCFLLVIGGFALYTPDKSIEFLKTKYADQDSRFVNIHGMDIHYKIEGEGMPLLLLHGTGSSLHTWDDWTNFLKDSFQVIRLDLPAYGLSGPRPDRDYSMSSDISFLDDFTDFIGVDSFHIAGNSFGGGLAFIYAGHFPEKVGKLILMDAAGLPNEDEPPMVFKLASSPILSMILKKITPKSFIKKNMLEVYYNDDLVTKDIVTRYHDMATRAGNRQAFIDRVRSPQEDHSELLFQLEEPTLIMWGEEDAWTPYKNAGIMHDMIPNSKSISISYPNVGHLPMEEYPIQSARDASLFLSEHLDKWILNI